MSTTPESFGVEEARKRLPELLERAASGERLVIRRHKKALAALVSLQDTLLIDPLEEKQAIQSLIGLQGSLKPWPRGADPQNNAPVPTLQRFEPRRLRRGSRICMDGSALMAFLSAQSASARLLEPLFQGIAQGTWQGVINCLSLMEVLERAIAEGDEALAQRYRAAFSGWIQVDVDPELVADATRLRAQEPKLGGLQAIELATAIRLETAVLVTTDADLAQTALHPVLRAL
jgi:antitoxin (DNA-binding transcriptional repressor) of toxin-antitoxin stability system/predicted nucleic acid-binding protein